MKKLLSSKRMIPSILSVLLLLIIWRALPENEIDFNTQVKPIINKHCISCHGGVKQSGGFSLLFEEEAKGNTGSGHPALIPGDAENSEMIRRLTSNDPEERMPYEKDALSKEEIAILKDWINQGAKWGTHWAYEGIKEIRPADRLDERSIHEIDLFVSEKLAEFGLQRNEEANVPTLALRLSLDLVGLPPTKEQINLLGVNPKPEDWTNYTESLLSSPHFGEKWAGMWMDLARYADTKGYERDDSRTIWKYRDWLIRAFNEDMPYNTFLTEQIAGDLLPDPTDDQLVATAFHRNTMTNDEGGTDNEEFRVEAVLDRVNTTWEVTMGTTFACVQCHSHPYDPFTHEDYYKFAAFFNNTRDEDTYDDYPVLRHFESDDSVKLVELRSWLNANTDTEKSKDIITFVKTFQPSINSLKSTDFVNAELADTKWLVFRNHGSAKFDKVNLDGKNTLICRYRSFLPGGVWSIYTDSLNGTLLRKIEVKDTEKKWDILEVNFQQAEGVHDLYFNYQNRNLSDPTSNGLMFDWLYFTEEFPGKGAAGSQQAKADFDYLLKVPTTGTPVMMENPSDMSRETHIFERGSWLTPGQPVSPGVPDVMNPMPAGSAANRLGLAQWMTDPQNPLTARTYVNRIWEQLFGVGIVETLEDFGSQGAEPTHPGLLDHLSWKFMNEFDWSTKRLLNYIVSSKTYRQSSARSPKQTAADPANRYFSSGPRVRLSAEQVRDRTLSVCGMLSEKMYGPSVKPYQPDGIWNSPYNGQKWEQSEGEDQYRRAVYTYWKRTSPYPSMLMFDMPAREVCAARRIDTNTPLQALVTLNDSAYIEAAVHFAGRMIREGGNSTEEQIKYGYSLMMYRDISEEKLNILMNLYARVSQEKLIKAVSLSEGDSSGQNHEAAMFVVANTMLNLDEFITKN